MPMETLNGDLAGVAGPIRIVYIPRAHGQVGLRVCFGDGREHLLASKSTSWASKSTARAIRVTSHTKQPMATLSSWAAAAYVGLAPACWTVIVTVSHLSLATIVETLIAFSAILCLVWPYHIIPRIWRSKTGIQIRCMRTGMCVPEPPITSCSCS